MPAACPAGIPVSKLQQTEREKLLGLREELHKRVVGQDAAVDVVASAVLRSRAGLAARNRGSSFLFLGPTGKLGVRGNHGRHSHASAYQPSHQFCNSTSTWLLTFIMHCWFMCSLLGGWPSFPSSLIQLCY